MKLKIAQTLAEALHELYQIDWQTDTSIIQNTKKFVNLKIWNITNL